MSMKHTAQPKVPCRKTASDVQSLSSSLSSGASPLLLGCKPQKSLWLCAALPQAKISAASVTMLLTTCTMSVLSQAELKSRIGEDSTVRSM
jgi:hypothetical protein